MLRSILAIILGFFISGAILFIPIALAILVFVVMAATGSGDGPPAPGPPGVGWLPGLTMMRDVGANLFFSLLAAVGGGLVAGIVARRAPLIHAAFLGVILFALSIRTAMIGRAAIAMGDAPPWEPGWYPLAIAVIGASGALLGGWIQQRRRRID